MKVYEFKASPNAYRVRLALAETDLTDQVEFVQVNILKGEHRQPEFLAKNPEGQIPFLELDDGTIIAECTAITEYLDHLKGEPLLTGKSAKERAVIHMAQRRAEANLLDAVATYFHHGTSGLGPALETYQNKEWGEKQKEKAIATMHKLNQTLAQQPYIAGDTFSIADVTVMGGLAFADFAKVPVPVEAENLLAWRDRVNARPSAKA